MTDKISAHNRIVAGTLAMALARNGYWQRKRRARIWSNSWQKSVEYGYFRVDQETICYRAGDPSDLQLEAFNFCGDAKTFNL